MQQFVKMGRGNGTMCISKGSDQWPGNYICEVGGGIKEGVGESKKKEEAEKKFKEPCV